MKNKIKFILPLLVVAIILTNPFKVIAEREKAKKTEKTEINGFINNFFDYKDKSKENNILTNQSKLYKNTLDIKDKEIGRIESSLFEQIDNKKLERYFKNYLKLENIVASISDIEEEILDIQTKKTVTYDNNNIYLNVERIKESIFTIQGTKFDEPSYESSKYTFVLFDFFESHALFVRVFQQIFNVHKIPPAFYSVHSLCFLFYSLVLTLRLEFTLIFQALRL